MDHAWARQGNEMRPALPSISEYASPVPDPGGATLRAYTRAWIAAALTSSPTCAANGLKLTSKRLTSSRALWS